MKNHFLQTCFRNHRTKIFEGQKGLSHTVLTRIDVPLSSKSNHK